MFFFHTKEAAPVVTKQIKPACSGKYKLCYWQYFEDYSKALEPFEIGVTMCLS